MIAWVTTIFLVLIILGIVVQEVRCGRRSSDFLDNVEPEIDQLKNRAIDKYRAKFGRDPTGPYVLVDPPRAPRRWFRK